MFATNLPPKSPLPKGDFERHPVSSLNKK